MGFDVEQYRQAIEKIEKGLTELDNRVQVLPGAANAALANPLMPSFVADAVIYLVKQLVNVVTTVAKKILELLKGAVAPIYMFKYAWDWEDVRGLTSNVVGNLRPEVLTAHQYWKGAASDAYTKATKPQSDAAAKVGLIADKAATSLEVCAVAGLAFYVALGVIVYQLIAATITAVTALGSVVFSWAGLALIVGEAAITPAMIIAAVSTLTALLGAQASQMSVLHGESVDNSVFPGGQWPKSASDTFSDATVQDGDADWSLQNP